MFDNNAAETFNVKCVFKNEGLKIHNTDIQLMDSNLKYVR